MALARVAWAKVVAALVEVEVEERAVVATGLAQGAQAAGVARQA